MFLGFKVCIGVLLLVVCVVIFKESNLEWVISEKSEVFISLHQGIKNIRSDLRTDLSNVNTYSRCIWKVCKKQMKQSPSITYEEIRGRLKNELRLRDLLKKISSKIY